VEFGKKAYLLRAVKTRKTLDIICYVQSGFPIKRKIDEKTGLAIEGVGLENSRAKEIKG
jgi:hypothetical protein